MRYLSNPVQSVAILLSLVLGACGPLPSPSFSPSSPSVSPASTAISSDTQAPITPLTSTLPLGWRSIGPEGGAVSALIIDPSSTNTLYVGTDSGVFKSIDGGAHWSRINNDMSMTNIFALSIDPATPATLYAATLGGLFSLQVDQ